MKTKKERKDGRKYSPQGKEAIRMQGVKAVLLGKSQVEVALLYGVTAKAVNNWMRVYRKGGMQALKGKKTGRPKGGSLKPWQSAQIAKIVIDRTPDQLKLPFYLWTREAVARLIKKRFDVELSIWTIGRYLFRWNFTPQKPIRKAFEQDSAAVRKWLKQEYPYIRRRAKAEKAQIYWGDEMGLRSDHVTGRTYGLKGKTPVIPGTGQRFGCNLISAITNRGRLYFMVYHKMFTTDIFIDFLRRLIRQLNRKFFLIIDQHRVHTSAKAMRWIKNYSHRLCVYYLPSYSPDLNPDEMLNNDVKSNAVGRRRPRHKVELASNVRGYLRSRQKQPLLVKNYFKKQSVAYAAK
jgi:transposase